MWFWYKMRICANLGIYYILFPQIRTYPQIWHKMNKKMSKKNKKIKMEDFEYKMRMNKIPQKKIVKSSINKRNV